MYGKLTGAETRGDGVRGVNVLQNVLTIKNMADLKWGIFGIMNQIT